MRRIIICRHTQTDHNVERRYTGQMDVQVNQIGRAQAAHVAQQIARLPGIRAVLSSDLQRTRYLAATIGRLTGRQPVLLPGLREVALGTLEGCTKAEVVARYPDPTYRTSNPKFDFRGDGGEDAGAVIRRQINALQAMAPLLVTSSRNQTARLVVVGHGTALRLLFRDHLGLIDRLHEQGEYQEVPWPW